MPVATDKNTSYGPPLVNQKYSPLLGPVVVPADRPIYSGLLQNRMRLLRAYGLIGAQLDLTVPNWANVVAGEAGHLPPLVVVSSNRATWMQAGIAAGAAEAAAQGLPLFANVSDLRALLNRSNSAMSPPLYAPSRIGLNRNVYVVVHITEYTKYRNALAGTGLIPVGWSFAKGVSSTRKLQMLGFGATRFAAMQFCKSLRQAVAAAGAAAPWDSAWMIDDNTVALSGFPGFAAVEAALGANACAGLRGGTLAETLATDRAWAAAQIAAGRGGQAANLPASNPPGVIQQCVLWNVAYFENQFLNFGPLFLASAEDLSMSKYFDATPIPYLFYTGIGIIKELPTHDNDTSAAVLNAGKATLTKLVTDAESVSPPAGTPPPPLLVQPANPADGGVQTLGDFIVRRVLPSAAAVSAQAGNVGVQTQAKSQGVEQLTCAGIGGGATTPAAIADTFQINAGAAQPVRTFNKP